MDKLSGFPSFLHNNGLLDYKQFEDYKNMNNYNAFKEISKNKIIFDKELIKYTFFFTGETLIDLTYFNLENLKLEQNTKFNKENLVIPIECKDGVLSIIVFNPFNQKELSQELQKKHPHDFIKIYISEKKGILNLNNKIEVAIDNNEFNIKENIKNEEIIAIEEAKVEEIKERKEIKENIKKITKKQESEEELKNITIQNFLKQVLTSSINSNADEIHFEPYETSYRVRFKQNNELYTSFNQPKEIGEDISRKIKEMANLDLNCRKPQFGSLSLKINSSKSIDFKISVCPLYVGDKIVFNVKNVETEKLNYDLIGLNAEEIIKINQSLEKKEGVFIFNGGKQSGRKHTMYSVLKSLDSKRLNIYTIENNVGFYLEDINQVKITKDFDYMEALDIISNQNPDVIMVDVVSDLDVLRKLFQMAKTGRMILFKTNLKNNKEVMQYLLHSGIQLLDIFTSLKLIVTQCLLKENCHNCETSDINVSPILLKEFNFTKSEIEECNKLWTPLMSCGCFECEERRYSGLISIFDIFVVTKEMKQLILAGQLKTFVDMIQNMDEDVLYKKAKIKFKDGLINFDELREVFY